MHFLFTFSLLLECSDIPFSAFLGIEPPTVRNKTKMQIIKALALDQDKYQNKKSILPLLSEGYKGCAFSSDSERKKSKLDAPDIGT